MPLPCVCFFIIVAIIVFCSATPHILRDLGSLTRDGTCAPCSGSALTPEPSGNSHGFYILFWHFVTLFWKCTMLNSRESFFHFCNEILFYHSFISIVFIFFSCSHCSFSPSLPWRSPSIFTATSEATFRVLVEGHSEPL